MSSQTFYIKLQDDILIALNESERRYVGHLKKNAIKFREVNFSATTRSRAGRLR
jgi:hypothetical protein